MVSDKAACDVVWPRGKKAVKNIAYARRLDSLEGKTIGVLWTWGFRGDVIFPMVERGLARRYPGVKFVGYNIFGSIHGGDEAQVLAALPDKLRQSQCDAIISGMGC